MYVTVILYTVLSAYVHVQLSCSPSSCSDSSAEDCSEQIAALDALIVELQDTKREIEQREESVGYATDVTDVAVEEASLRSEVAEGKSCADPMESLSLRQQSPIKHVSSLDLVMFDKKKRIEVMEEKEKVLNECKNQIKVRFGMCMGWIQD